MSSTSEPRQSFQNAPRSAYPEHLQYWKEKIVTTTYWAGMVFAAFAFIPSLYFLIRDREWVVIAVDTAAMVWAILVVIRPARFPYSVRTGVMLLAIFAIGSAVLWHLGPFSTSLVWLFAFTVMSSLIGGTKGGIISLLLNLALFGLIGGLIGFQHFTWAKHVADPGYRWVVIISNFMLLDILIIASIMILTRGLQFNNFSALSALDRLNQEQIDLQQALREKNALLREVHHRVKNNLQVVSSLLNLQINQESDPKITDAIQEARHRVSAMALVHETIYRNGNPAAIDLAMYIQSLIDSMMDFFDWRKNKISVETDLQPGLSVGIDQATPCGLAINELITNAVKHAFPEGQAGSISISARSLASSAIEIVLKDDGVGLPEDMDWRRDGRLGLYLIVNLVESQLRGNLELIRDQGTEFRIRFNPLIEIKAETTK